MNGGALLFRDLAVMMTVVGVSVAIFSRFGWPKVLGFILAGVLMGANSWSGAWLVDETSVQSISQLGIFFLMFALGLEFSIGAMRRVGHVTAPTALVDVISMVWLGYIAGTKILGWGRVQSLFLGAAICDSATTLLSKTIEEMNWSGRPFVRYIFGTTIMEDILCVGVLAAVTGVAGGGATAGGVGASMGKLALFLTGAIVLGMTIIPRALDKTRRHGREAVLLVSLGFCFLVSAAAEALGAGIALGAFTAGVICASSSVRDELHAMIEPLRSMFSAMFFVAIGLLVDPAAFLDHWRAIAAISALVVFGKFANVTLASLLAGQSVKNAVQSGMGLAQIGEFAYMVAMIYVTVSGRPNDPMFQIVVGVSIATTVLNPLLLKLSDPVGDWFERRQPAGFRRMMAGYAGWLERFRTAKTPSRQKTFLRIYAAGMVVSLVMMFIDFEFCAFLSDRDFTRFGVFFEENKRLLLCLAANAAALVPLISMAVTSGKLGRLAGALVASTWTKKGVWRRASQSVVRTFVRTLCLCVTVFAIVAMNLSVMPEEIWARVLVFGGIGLYAAFQWNAIRKRGKKSARRFRAALAAEKRREAEKQAAVVEMQGPAPHGGVRQRKLAVPEGSPFDGETIATADIRRRTGATVICLERGGEAHWNPGPGWRLEAGDILYVIADADHYAQLEAIAARPGPSS